MSQLTRAAGEGTGTGEGVDALIKRLVTGSLVKRLEVDRNRTIAVDRAMARGQREADAAHAVERRTDVQDYAAQFLQLGVSSAEALIDQNWDGVDRSERSVIVAALKEANRKNRRFGELLARWRAENRSVSEREEPYVQLEVQRKGLIPITPRR